MKVYIKWINYKEKKKNNGYTIQDKDRLPLGHVRGLLETQAGFRLWGENLFFKLGGGCMGVHFIYQAQH